MATTSNETSRDLKDKKDQKPDQQGSKSDPGYIPPEEEQNPSRQLRGIHVKTVKPSPDENKPPQTLQDEQDSASM